VEECGKTDGGAREMTIEEKIIAVALKAGWRDCRRATLIGRKRSTIIVGNRPEFNHLRWPYKPLPNWPGSLDAMAEIEATMDLDQCLFYDKRLAEATATFTWKATAPERFDAWGITMKLWKEGE